MKHRLRAVLLGGLIAITAVTGATTVASGGLGAQAASPPGHRGPGLVLPSQVDPHAVKAVTQANYPNLHINDPALLPRAVDTAGVAQDPTRRPVTQFTANGCYSPGQAGYQAYPSECVPGNFTKNGSSCCLHEGVDPYNGAGRYRYVYVVDEMEGTRASQWLAYAVNWLNSTFSQEGGAPLGNRPYFLYYTGSYLRGANGAAYPYGYADYQNCQAGENHRGFQGFMEFCARPNQATSDATWFADGYNRFTYGWGRIKYTDSSWDVMTAYSVTHEFGHLQGLAHNTDCDSTMTYCSTVGNQQLWYNGTDNYDMRYLYDYMYTGPSIP